MESKPDSNQVGALAVMFALPLFAGAHGTPRHLLIKGRAVDLTNYIFLPCGLGRPSNYEDTGSQAAGNFLERQFLERRQFSA